ncbi:MAG: Wzz/FepE/Etk N-terminal domain-containing protein [Flavobacteriales bacterium]|nr:Wzz/FepE/Etk N-terminal domain-containing protein [Flavobacteriales bacterium]
MIDENQIIRKEEVDFRGVLNRVKRGWPIIAVSLFIWIALGVLFQIAVPPYYTAQTSVLTEEPKGQQDPAVLVTGEPVNKKPESYYFTNQRIVFATFPLIEEAVKKTGMIKYFKSGLINQEIFGASPFLVELDSTFMTFEKSETPYETAFYVDFENFNSYHVEGEGKYLETSEEFFYEGDYQFGEWVEFGNLKFRLIPQDTLLNPQITQISDLSKDEFGFNLLDLETQTLELAKKMEVINVDIESTVFTASLSGFSAGRQKTFLSELGEVFLETQMELKTATLKKALEFLNEEIDRTSFELEESEDSLKYFKSENSITSITAEGTLLLSQTADLQDQKVELVVRNKYYSYLEENLRENDDYSTLISPEAFGVDDALLIRLTQELVELQQDLTVVESKGAQDNPAYQQIKGAIASKRATILKSVEGFKSSNLIKLRDVEKRISDIDKSTKEFPAEESQLLKLERRFRINETLYTSLMEKKSTVELSLVSMTSDFRIIEPARLTSVDPIFPWAPITFVLALFLGLVTGFGLLIIIWIFSNGIDSSSDVKRHLPNANILGEIFYSSIQKPRELEEYSSSPLANQMNGLVYNFNTKKTDAFSLGLSSWKPSEGKTFTASMLAVQYAASGSKVLIIDANLKHQSIGKKFRLTATAPDLNSFSPQALSESVQNTSNNHIDVLNLGTVVFNVAEIMSFREFLTNLKGSYDRVIVDLAPIGNDARSLAILNATDIPIILTRKGRTNVQDLLDIRDLHDKGSLKELNCIVTGSFSQNTSLSLKRNPYEKNKRLSIFERIKVAFAKV